MLQLFREKRPVIRTFYLASIGLEENKNWADKKLLGRCSTCWTWKLPCPQHPYNHLRRRQKTKNRIYSLPAAIDNNCPLKFSSSWSLVSSSSRKKSRSSCVLSTNFPLARAWLLGVCDALCHKNTSSSDKKVCSGKHVEDGTRMFFGGDRWWLLFLSQQSNRDTKSLEILRVGAKQILPPPQNGHNSCFLLNLYPVSW